MVFIYVNGLKLNDRIREMKKINERPGKERQTDDYLMGERKRTRVGM
jgi:hypothetical protein